MATIITNEKQIIRAVTKAIAQIKNMKYISLKNVTREQREAIATMRILKCIQEESNKKETA